jgi:hypothetical protein
MLSKVAVRSPHRFSIHLNNDEKGGAKSTGDALRGGHEYCVVIASLSFLYALKKCAAVAASNYCVHLKNQHKINMHVFLTTLN